MATKRETVREWVRGFNGIPTSMLKQLYYMDEDSVREVTPPTTYSDVYIFEFHDGSTSHEGEITGYDKITGMYNVRTDDGVDLVLHDNQFVTSALDDMPTWGTMWSFDEWADKFWLTEKGGIELMANCGFRIYETDWGYFFGIDGCGCDFYEMYWTPLYDARGLQWHDEEERTA